jgi:hypothetical protein
VPQGEIIIIYFGARAFQSKSVSRAYCEFQQSVYIELLLSYLVKREIAVVIYVNGVYISKEMSTECAVAT